jgi:hypothetical protein
VIEYEILSPSASLPLSVVTRLHVDAFSGIVPLAASITGALSFTLLIAIVMVAVHVPPLPSEPSIVRTYHVVVSKSRLVSSVTITCQLLIPNIPSPFPAVITYVIVSSSASLQDTTTTTAETAASSSTAHVPSSMFGSSLIQATLILAATVLDVNTPSST